MSAFAYKYDTTEDHSLNKVMLIFATRKSDHVTDAEIMETYNQELDRLIGQ
jgi:hypothetical protein